jgi:hypothetical protein
MNTHIPHISFSELADIAEEHSSASAEILQHLAACSHCSQELRAIRQTLALMKSDHTEAAPVELVNYAKNLFRGQRGAPKPSLVERVLAVLAFDSLTVAPGFGLRSGLAAGRQLIYSTEMADIDLRVSPQSGEWEIAGQILGSSHSEGKVNLESDAFSASANLNELSEFSFRSVPRGTYRMFVHLPNLEIETPPLEVGQ